MNSLEKYNKIFMTVLGVPETALNDSFTFKDVPVWDSVAHLSLISMLEDEFDVQIDPEKTENIKTVGEAVELLKSAISNK